MPLHSRAWSNNMLDIWILIIFFSTNRTDGGVSVHSVEFNSRKACVVAAKDLEGISARMSSGMATWSIQAVCEKKDK